MAINISTNGCIQEAENGTYKVQRDGLVSSDIYWNVRTYNAYIQTKSTAIV